MADPVRTLRPVLDATGLPWLVKVGGRHRKVFLAGRLVCVLPLGRSSDGDSHATRNTRAQIRRLAREIAHDPA